MGGEETETMTKTDRRNLTARATDLRNQAAQETRQSARAELLLTAMTLEAKAAR